jgi:hypothetical protein
MKRIVVGVIWFLVLFFGILFVGSAIVGGIAGSKTRGEQQGAVVGERAGRAFGERYGTVILLGSLLIAVAGSATGVLPGTRARED